MSKIQQLLKGKVDQINYSDILNKYPWILRENSKCIISPDSDGLLCGLLMSYYMNWEVTGFYDGKVLLLKEGESCFDSVFLDMEILRSDIKSIGHHMTLYNKNNIPMNYFRWKNNNNCIQPNLLRNYDGCHNFRLKYPLAAVHLILGIIGSKIKIDIPESAICPLLFTDGTFNVLFKYPENVLNWLKYLRADEENNPLNYVFENEKYSVIALMRGMDEFFRKRDQFSITRERGDRLKISEKDGTVYNVTNEVSGTLKIIENTQKRIINFIKLLSDLTGWAYNETNWNWDGLKLYEFTKGDFKSQKLRVNTNNFEKLINKNPLSLAMTSGDNIEYTLEKPDSLP